MNRKMHAHAGTGKPRLLVTDGGTPPDQELRLGRFRQDHPDIEIILRGPWQAVITEPDGERTIVRWELHDLLDQLDRLLDPPAGGECLT
jgi:hypothetical protein